MSATVDLMILIIGPVRDTIKPFVASTGIERTKTLIANRIPEPKTVPCKKRKKYGFD